MRARDLIRGTGVVLGLWAVVFLCGATWMEAQNRLDARRRAWPDTYPLMYVPSGRYLQGMTLGYRSVVADLLYLWSIQFYGYGRDNPEGRRWLEHIYDVITDLDPQYVDAYMVGSLIMSADMQSPEMGLALLDKGARENPDDWLLPLNAGFTAYMNLEDYERAEAYFQEAARRGAPDYAERLRAHMRGLQGDLEAALGFWLEIYDDAVGAGDEQVEAIAENHIVRLRVQIDLRQIRAAIERYRQDRGRLPASLGSLVEGGYLAGRPVNPNGTLYVYDPVTGEVSDPDAGQTR